jgi:hypothetical protein
MESYGTISKISETLKKSNRDCDSGKMVAWVQIPDLSLVHCSPE